MCAPRLTAAILALVGTAVCQTYTIHPVAGGALPDDIQGSAAALGTTIRIAADSADGVYFTVERLNALYRLNAETGLLTRVAGDGTPGSRGDWGPAIQAQLDLPRAVALGAQGSLYIADRSRIRKIANGIISTVASLGGVNALAVAANGDIFAATSARVYRISGEATAVFADLFNVKGLAFDAAGELYAADAAGARIVKLSGGSVTVVAGGSGVPGDLSNPSGIAVGPAGELFIADFGNDRVRKFDNGVFTTVAQFAGLSSVSDVAIDRAGVLHIVAYDRIYRLAAGLLTVEAGGGSHTPVDGTPVSAARFLGLSDLDVDAAGVLYAADDSQHRVFGISDGTVNVFAGTGGSDYSGDGGPATSAMIGNPASLAIDGAGGVLVGDGTGRRIRRVFDGSITTAADSLSRRPLGLAAGPGGDVYFSDWDAHCVRGVLDGVERPVAGACGFGGSSGDNGPATLARLYRPQAIATGSAGNLYIAEREYGRVRMVSDGTITTVAGGGSSWLGADGPATAVSLSSPGGVAVDNAGNLYVAEGSSSRIRKVSGGVITTIAGDGTSTHSGDGGPALDATVAVPTAIVVDSAGTVYFVESLSNRIRKLVPSGPSCEYSVGLSSASASVEGGSVSASIATGSECSWAVTYLPSWASINVGALQGTGPANLELKLDPSASGPRTAMAVIAGKPVWISQGSCTYSLSPWAVSVPAERGDVSVNVTAAAGCSWQAVSNVAWVTPSGPVQGSGNKTVTLTVLSNLDPVARTGTVTIGGQLLSITQAGRALPRIDSVRNAADFESPIATAAWVAISGANLSTATRVWTAADFAGNKLPTQLDGIAVNINGKPAYVYYVSPSQINVLAPDDAAEGQVTVEVVAPYGRATVTVTKAALSPAWFRFEAGGGGYIAAVHPDGTYLGKPSLYPTLPLRPAKTGDVILLYGTGFGPATPPAPSSDLVAQPGQLASSPVRVEIGGVPAVVEWAGLVSSGLYQFNIRVPDLPDGDHSVVVWVGESRTLSTRGSITVENKPFPYVLSSTLARGVDD